MPACADLAVLADRAAGDGSFAGVSDDELTGMLCAWDRLESHAAARKLAAAAALSRRRPPLETSSSGQPAGTGGEDFAADELAHVLAVSRREAAGLLTVAEALEGKLPGTRALLRDGIITAAKAKMIVSHTALLTEREAAAVEALVLGRAGRITPGSLREALARAVLEVAPQKARERREQAAKRARVERWGEDSGNGALAGRELPPAWVLAMDQRITWWAVQLKRAGLEGDMDLLRARALADLVTGTDSRPGHHGTAPAHHGPGHYGAAPAHHGPGHYGAGPPPPATTSTTPPTRRAGGRACATAIRSAGATTASSSIPGGASSSTRTGPSPGPRPPGGPTPPNPPGTPSSRRGHSQGAVTGFTLRCITAGWGGAVMAGPGDAAAEDRSRGELRASHADREQVIGRIKAAFVQGMLAKGEFDQRVEEAFAARTQAELAVLTADFPVSLVAEPPPKPVRAQDEQPTLRPGWVLSATTALYAGVWAVALIPSWPVNSEGDPPRAIIGLVFLSSITYLLLVAVTAGIVISEWLEKRSPSGPGQGEQFRDGPL